MLCSTAMPCGMPGMRLLSSRTCLSDTSCGWVTPVTPYLAQPSHVSGLTGKRQRGVTLVQAKADDIEGPLLVPISAAGSLDGSSAEAFGPLVSFSELYGCSLSGRVSQQLV